MAVSFGCAPMEQAVLGLRQVSILGGRDAERGSWPNVVWLDVGCSGVLVHPRVVLYAAHCGVDVTSVWTGEELDLDRSHESVEVVGSNGTELGVERCGAYPNASVFSDNDLAYCILRVPLLVPVAPIIAGCERERIDFDQDAILVGYGFDALAGGVSGKKRYVEAPIAVTGESFQIGDADRGTCAGDSGGPAFIRLPTSDPDAEGFRLLGVLSSGEVGACGSGSYVDVARFVDWLEEELQLDLTPCTDSIGTWNPSPRCAEANLDESGRSFRGESAWIETCGSSAVLPETDEAPPELQLVDLHWDRAARRISVRIEATGAALESLSIEAFTAGAWTRLGGATDEITPYDLDQILPGSEEPDHITATATTFSGRSTVARWAIDRRSEGAAQCSTGTTTVTGARRHPDPSFPLLCALAALIAARRHAPARTQVLKGPARFQPSRQRRKGRQSVITLSNGLPSVAFVCGSAPPETNGKRAPAPTTEVPHEETVHPSRTNSAQIHRG